MRDRAPDPEAQVEVSLPEVKAEIADGEIKDRIIPTIRPGRVPIPLSLEVVISVQHRLQRRRLTLRRRQ